MNIEYNEFQDQILPKETFKHSALNTFYDSEKDYTQN